MSEIIDPEIDQDQIGQTSADSPVASADEKKGIKDQILGMDLYNVMLLISLIFIVVAILYMLGVLRTYSPSFPFGGFPWNASEFQTLMPW